MYFLHDADKDDLLLEGGLMVSECAALYVPPGADIPKSQQFNSLAVGAPPEASEKRTELVLSGNRFDTASECF